jgi:hypothetical protein
MCLLRQQLTLLASAEAAADLLTLLAAAAAAQGLYNMIPSINYSQVLCKYTTSKRTP